MALDPVTRHCGSAANTQRHSRSLVADRGERKRNELHSAVAEGSDQIRPNGGCETPS